MGMGGGDSVDSSGKTLKQCLKHFGLPEKLDKGEEWYCNKCKKHVSAMKTLRLMRLPNIFIVALKRFDYTGSRAKKLDYLIGKKK